MRPPNLALFTLCIVPLSFLVYLLQWTTNDPAKFIQHLKPNLTSQQIQLVT
ncbi:hypothetical protein HanRHA438_Chr12g0570661 [Helianthus annuus]|nr:hypothetical protein HanRHA438_Chr12g0570661 [Helianthus annuus]